MLASEFRSLALAQPGSSEGQHHGHADFRLAGRIFATLDRSECIGVVRLSPARQHELLNADHAGCEAAAGAWGRAGYTKIELALADTAWVAAALAHAAEFAFAASKARRRPKT